MRYWFTSDFWPRQADKAQFRSMKAWQALVAIAGLSLSSGQPGWEKPRIRCYSLQNTCGKGGIYVAFEGTRTSTNMLRSIGLCLPSGPKDGGALMLGIRKSIASRGGTRSLPTSIGPAARPETITAM
eukprot:Skav216006  [mRNA]  locus=scaffold833:116313:116693:+ [translate_table: standard]